MTRQLPLPFAETQDYHAEDFLVAPCNALAHQWLQSSAGWTNGRMILYGEAGCGKSFLLHLWARDYKAVIHQASSLRGNLPWPASPIGIDDADTVPEETALLHLLNAAAASRIPVLLTARQPPSRQHFTLPDLASRLRASLVVEIGPADDTMLSTLLLRMAAARQLRITPALADFLLRHLPRTPAALREAIARLDRAALASGGKITRNLAVQTLGDLLNPSEPASIPVEEELLSNRHSPDPSFLL